MNLKQIRQKKQYTQKQLAKILEINISQISRAEKGEQKLNSDQIIKLCKAMNISADYLLGLIDSPENFDKEVIK